ncbi:MAG: large-conductance mechanosensitive channel protein MscL [Candidatus Sericytochromatia bacterium]
MGLVQEFKEFAVKGNVMDLAVGVIIGGAFGKITDSLVKDIIMPPIGLMMGGVNFKEIAIPLKAAVTDAAGKVTQEAVSINIGNFLQVIIDFAILAFAVFMIVKALNKLKRNPPPAPPEAPPAPTKEEILLTEIRDAIRQKSI